MCIFLENILILKKSILQIRRFSRLGKEETKAASITRMLFMVVLLFGVCSSVEVARRIWIFFDKDIVEKPHYDHMINHFSDVFYVFNSAANFIIYYCWGTEFRKVFFQVFSFGGRDVIQSEVATSENIIAPSGSITEQGWIWPCKSYSLVKLNLFVKNHCDTWTS